MISSRVLVVLMSACCTALPCQTAEEIVAKHIDARGGAAKFAAIRTMRVTGRIKFGDGEFGPITVLATAAGKFRMELNAGDVHVMQGFDGDKAWQGSEA